MRSTKNDEINHLNADWTARLRSTSKTFRITKYCKWFESTNRNTDTRKTNVETQLTDTKEIRRSNC